MTTPDSPAPPAAAAVPVRIRHVDSLRAVAAGLVVWIHYAQFIAKAAPGPASLGFLRTIPKGFDLGRLGVLIFFAISGFVICRSFGGPREGGARRFLIRRFCRLYPAYWVSMAVGWLAWRVAGRGWDWPALAANATMAAALFDQPYLLGVYWTLGLELLFYALCLALYLARCLERRALLAAVVLGLVWLPRMVKIIGHHTGVHLVLSSGLQTPILSLAVMFWGMLFRLAYDATGGFRRGVLTHDGTWLVAAMLWELIDAPDPNFKWYVLGQHPGPRPGHVVLVSAVLIFTLWVAALRVDNRVLTFLGVISYSVYLLHMIPLILCEQLLLPEGAWWRRLPFWLDFLGCVGVSVALAAAVYRWVERPAIALGKRWAAATGVSYRGKRDATM